MGRTGGVEADSPDPARVSPWQAAAYPPPARSGGMPGSHGIPPPGRGHKRRRRRPARLATYLLVVLALVVGAYFAAPVVASWLRDVYSASEPAPIAAECEQAFSAAVDSGAVEDRLITLLECTEGEWKLQQATTPMDDVSFEALCAFRGELVAESCKDADAQRQIQASIDAQNTTTVPPAAAADPSSPGTRSDRGVRRRVPGDAGAGVPGQVTPPQPVPQPVPNQGLPTPRPAQPDPNHVPRHGGTSGGGGTPGPSFSQPGGPLPSSPPGPSF